MRIQLVLLTIACCLMALAGLTAAADDVDFCPCPRDFNPVCGTDNVTYSNFCELDCAAKKAARQGRSLSQAKPGRC